MSVQTIVSAKGQVVIPKDVRDRMHLMPGDRLEVVERPDGVLLRKTVTAPTGDFDEIAARIHARVRYEGPPVSLAEMNEAVSMMWTSGGPAWDG